jgi:hypothetical protein
VPFAVILRKIIKVFDVYWPIHTFLWRTALNNNYKLLSIRFKRAMSESSEKSGFRSREVELKRRMEARIKLLAEYSKA